MLTPASQRFSRWPFSMVAFLLPLDARLHRSTRWLLQKHSPERGLSVAMAGRLACGRIWPVHGRCRPFCPARLWTASSISPSHASHVSLPNVFTAKQYGAAPRWVRERAQSSRFRPPPPHASSQARRPLRRGDGVERPKKGKKKWECCAARHRFATLRFGEPVPVHLLFSLFASCLSARLRGIAGHRSCSRSPAFLLPFASASSCNLREFEHIEDAWHCDDRRGRPCRRSTAHTFRVHAKGTARPCRREKRPSRCHDQLYSALQAVLIAAFGVGTTRGKVVYK